ncbi:hypothetical protein [Rhizobium sp. HT1-10]|uniref:hypothetical protein n=1 Tax=Rhizobium sp. HT1-10 TaxID=3111638 RepID=UPI003C1D81E8
MNYPLSTGDHFHKFGNRRTRQDVSGVEVKKVTETIIADRQLLILVEDTEAKRKVVQHGFDDMVFRSEVGRKCLHLFHERDVAGACGKQSIIGSVYFFAVPTIDLQSNFAQIARIEGPIRSDYFSTMMYENRFRLWHSSPFRRGGAEKDRGDRYLRITRRLWICGIIDHKNLSMRVMKYIRKS